VTPWMGITASTGAGMPSSTWRLAAAMICVLRPMIDRARGRIARAWLEQTGMRPETGCRVSTDAAGLGAVDSYRELRGVRNRRASRDGSRHSRPPAAALAVGAPPPRSVTSACCRDSLPPRQSKCLGGGGTIFLPRLSRRVCRGGGFWRCDEHQGSRFVRAAGIEDYGLAGWGLCAAA